MSSTRFSQPFRELQVYALMRKLSESGWMGQAWGSLQVTEQQVKKLVHASL